MAEEIPDDAGASPAASLRSLDDAYASAEPATYADVPDGTYTVRVEHVTLGCSQKGTQMLTYDLVVLAGRHAKRHMFKHAVITQESLPYVKRDLQMMGLDLPRISDLPDYLSDMEGLMLQVTKRTKGGFENVYFTKLVADPSE